MPWYTRLCPISLAGALKIIPAALAAGALLFATGAATARCPTPQITGVTERDGPNCWKTSPSTCGFVVVRWSGSKECNHFNIRDNLGSQFEAPGTDRNQLYNKRSAQFPGRYAVNDTTIYIMMQGCSRNLVGVSDCGPWTARVSFFLDSGSGKGDTPRAQQCRTYATQAIAAVKQAFDVYGCKGSQLTGGRWSRNFDEHLRWCMRADAKTVNFEHNERMRIMLQCRTAPPSGALRLTIRQGSGRGDFFLVSGTGYPPNAPIVLRLTGAAALTPSIPNIMTDARGNFSTRLNGIQVCKAAGQVTFVAEERDHGRKSNPFTVTCKPN